MNYHPLALLRVFAPAAPARLAGPTVQMTAPSRLTSASSVEARLSVPKNGNRQHLGQENRLLPRLPNDEIPQPRVQILGTNFPVLRRRTAKSSSISQVSNTTSETMCAATTKNKWNMRKRWIKAARDTLGFHPRAVPGELHKGPRLKAEPHRIITAYPRGRSRKQLGNCRAECVSPNAKKSGGDFRALFSAHLSTHGKGWRSEPEMAFFPRKSDEIAGLQKTGYPPIRKCRGRKNHTGSPTEGGRKNAKSSCFLERNIEFWKRRTSVSSQRI
jgi:hypothetical protein